MVTFKLALRILSCFAIITAITNGLLERDVDGSLGLGREFSLDNVGGITFVEGVEESGDCCEVCQDKDKDMQMFNFHKEDKQCQCLKTAPDQRPVTNEARVFSGFCHENGVPDINLNRGRRESHYQYRYKKSVGTVGVDRMVKQDTVLVQGGVDSVNNSSLCCEECRSRFTDTELYQFDNFYYNYCHCFKIVPGTKPVTAELEHTADICHSAEDLRQLLLHEDREPVALAVPSTGCEELVHGIPCCPHMVQGDNNKGSEIFVDEDSMMSSCIETCKTLYPTAVGVTESKSELYGNGQRKCWCEFGEQNLNRSGIDYQTCLYKD